MDECSIGPGGWIRFFVFYAKVVKIASVDIMKNNVNICQNDFIGKS